MAPNDLAYLVTYIVGLIGDILVRVGDTWAQAATVPAYMKIYTIGVYGEDGGLIYWWNEKLLWLLAQILDGLSFTFTPV